MRLHNVPPTLDIEAARRAVAGALVPFANRLTPIEQLAVVAYLCGQLIALQDQTKITAEQALDLVSANLELGNSHAINGMLAPTAGNA